MTDNIIVEKIKVNENEIKEVKYKKGKYLGKGGFALCYQIENINTGEQLAVKQISKQTLLKGNTKKKLLQEIKLHKQLDHKNIVKFQSVFEDEDYVYMILELCQNFTFSELLKQRKRITELEIQFFIYHLISSLIYLQDNGIIHRDIKLGNIFLSNDLQPKLGDFGLATFVNQNEGKKKTICGTPNYIAPEVINSDSKGYSFEVDLWSLGVLTYTLLVGKPPFETSSINTTYIKIKKADYH